MTESKRYRNPAPTVDVIIELGAGEDDTARAGPRPPQPRIALPRIVLIERANEPRGWALPGGFVDYGESLADAARREAAEETGLEIELDEQFFSYSRPDRDPRRHTMSTVFLARAWGQPVAADDAARAQVVGFDALPSPLVFDHAQILADYIAYRTTGRRPPPDR